MSSRIKTNRIRKKLLWNENGQITVLELVRTFSGPPFPPEILRRRHRTSCEVINETKKIFELANSLQFINLECDFGRGCNEGLERTEAMARRQLS